MWTSFIQLPRMMFWYENEGYVVRMPNNLNPFTFAQQKKMEFLCGCTTSFRLSQYNESVFMDLLTLTIVLVLLVDFFFCFCLYLYLCVQCSLLCLSGKRVLIKQKLVFNLQDKETVVFIKWWDKYKYLLVLRMLTSLLFFQSIWIFFCSFQNSKQSSHFTFFCTK